MYFDTSMEERALYFLLLVTAKLNYTDLFLQYLKEVKILRLPMLVYLFIDPLLANFRDVPAFRQLMQEVLGEEHNIDFSRKRYKKQLLSPSEIHEHRATLEQLMIEKQPFLSPELTLRTLAEQVRLPANYLSQLLNEGFGQNFAEFVNSYRLEAFKQRLLEPTSQQLTLLALAFESGFNSKTVFNTFFKKQMGMTPRAYWKKVADR